MVMMLYNRLSVNRVKTECISTEVSGIFYQDGTAEGPESLSVSCGLRGGLIKESDGNIRRYFWQVFLKISSAFSGLR